MKSKEIICKALGLTDLQYGEHVFECATLWMQRYFNGNEIMIKALENAPSFWAWWSNQWEIRNQKYISQSNIDVINEPLEGITRDAAIELYNDAHDIWDMRVFPNKIVRIEAGREIIKQYETIKVLKNDSNS